MAILRKLSRNILTIDGAYIIYKTKKYIIDDIDLILVMTVNPGFAGWKMIPAILKKSNKPENKLNKNGLNIDL